jgi:hypothetical protein
MVDLQRSMGRIWNIARARMQGISRNSDADALTDSNSRGKFSSPGSAREFYSDRFDLSSRELLPRSAAAMDVPS